MKRLIFYILINLFFIAQLQAAPQRAVLIDATPQENAFGTLENPIHVRGGGGSSSILETSMIALGRKDGNTGMTKSTNLVTYNGNQYYGGQSASNNLQLCKRATDAVAWTCVEYHGVPKTPTFSGSGLNDLTSGGVATSGITATSTYEVTIDATGAPDTFKWRLNGGSYTSGVAITGSAQTLSNGVTVTFAATTGHTLNDTWSVVVNPKITPGNDIHQSVGLGFDSTGILHVDIGSYVTVSGLVYRRSTSAESIDGLTATQTINATYDSQASYVTFFRDNNGALFCIYRSNGASGDADTFMWKYNTSNSTWARATGTRSSVVPGSFIDGNGSSRSAYFGHPYVDSSNNMHLIWSWRDNSADETGEERGIGYVKYDLTNGTFTQADGDTQTIPITTSNYDAVSSAGVSDFNDHLEGMQYRSAFAFDSQNRETVVVSYEDTNDHRQLWIIRHNGTSWSSPIQLTNSMDTHLSTSLPFLDKRAVLLSENDTMYVIYDAYTEGGGINVIRTDDDWATFNTFSLINVPTGQWGPGYMPLSFDRAAWNATGNFYAVFQNNFDFQDIVQSRSPVYVVKWDASGGANIRQHQWSGIMNYDDITFRSSAGYIRNWGTMRYDAQNTWKLAATDDINTWTGTGGRATDGDIVELAAGTYTTTADIDMVRAVTVRGQGGYSQGCKTTITSSTDSINGFDVLTSNVRLEDLCISMTGQTDRAINCVRASSGVYTGLFLKDVGITMSGTGSKVGLQVNNCSGAGEDVYMSIVSSNNTARGLYGFNTSVANAATSFTADRFDVATTGGATISIPFESTDSSATQDFTLTLRNSKGIATETGSTTSAGVRAPGDANGIVNIEGGWYSGTDNDLSQSSTGVMNIKGSVHLVNRTISGNPNFLGMQVSGNIGIGTNSANGALIVKSGFGNVGIGTLIPQTELVVNGLITPKKVTGDPCSAGLEGGAFYNDTSNYWCYCDGTNDVKMNDPGTACF